MRKFQIPKHQSPNGLKARTFGILGIEYCLELGSWLLELLLLRRSAKAASPAGIRPAGAEMDRWETREGERAAASESIEAMIREFPKELGLCLSVGFQRAKNVRFDGHRDGQRFIVRADEKLTAFLELESASCRRGESRIYVLTSHCR